jgi:hypothetical protein
VEKLILAKLESMCEAEQRVLTQFALEGKR